MKERQYRRIPFAAEVTLKIDQSVWKGGLLDIALKGAMVGTDASLPIGIGAECTLSIYLPATSINLEFLARLSHNEENRYGFEFLSEDLDTLTHLRKLIELNTGDAETTRSELSVWLNG